MARIADIPKLASEIKKILIKYNGVPSASVDRNAYARIYASFKKYANEPEFVSLINEFNIRMKDGRISVTNGHGKGGSKVDLKQKAKELIEIARGYNGMPSQKQDRAAYAAISYYIKNYGDYEEFRELIELCNTSSIGRASYDEKYAEIEQILKEGQRIPAVKDNPTQYRACRYFFRKHFDKPEVKRLMYIYASASLFPLPNTKFGPRPDPQMEEYLILNSERSVYMSANPEYYKWRRNVNYEYIRFVYEEYAEFPAHNTRPMQFLLKEIEHWERYNIDSKDTERNEALLAVLNDLIDLGCKEPYIVRTRNSLLIQPTKLNDAVRQLVIENGSCAVHYIAETAIPSMPLSDKYVYYYFYNLHNDRPADRSQLPCLGELYAWFNENAILRVHYRDLDKCNVNCLRAIALITNRDWEALPPVTIDDWNYYGICMFFMAEKHSTWSHLTFNTEINYIENCFREGHEYFRFRASDYGLRYADYVLFLLENDYKLGLKGSSDIVDGFTPDKLCSFNQYQKEISKDDAMTIYSILCKRDDCVESIYGGVYSNINNEKCLLMFPPNAVSYRISSGTKKIYNRATITCKDSLTRVITNSVLENISCSFCSCEKLVEIIVPTQVVEKYQKIFSKHDASFFKDRHGKVIPQKAIFEGSKLVSVPYGDYYEVPEGVTEIAKDAFDGSDVKKVVIAGSVKEIHESIFWCNKTVEEVYLSEGIEVLDGSIFGYCPNLNKIHLPSSLHKISGSILYNSPKVKSLIFPGDVELGYQVFKNCSLEYLCFRGHVNSFDKEFGYGCRESLKRVDFMGGIDSLSYFFFFCPFLEEVEVTGRCKSLYEFEKFNLKKNPMLKKITVSEENAKLFRSQMPSDFHYLLHIQ